MCVNKYFIIIIVIIIIVNGSIHWRQVSWLILMGGKVTPKKVVYLAADILLQ